MKTKTDRTGSTVRDLHGRRVKEPIGRGVFADDPHKNKCDIVFKRDHVVMLYQGEVVTDQEAALRYGLHTNPYNLKRLREYTLFVRIYIFCFFQDTFLCSCFGVFFQFSVREFVDVIIHYTSQKFFFSLGEFVFC